MHRQWDDDAPMWAVIMIMQNEAILAALEKRASKLSPEDQRDVDAAYEIAARTKRKLDAALKS